MPIEEIYSYLLNQDVDKHIDLNMFHCAYICAVLQYLCGEFIEIAGYKSNKSKPEIPSKSILSTIIEDDVRRFRLVSAIVQLINQGIHQTSGSVNIQFQLSKNFVNKGLWPVCW